MPYFDKPGEFSLKAYKRENDSTIYYASVLQYSGADMTITFEPENPHQLADVNLDKDVQFTCRTVNGTYTLNWVGNVISIEIEKYGIHTSGSMVVAIDKTPEKMLSLMTCLKKWQSLYK